MNRFTFFALITLNALDAVLTTYGVTTGYVVEENPILRSAMGAYGIAVVMIAKLVIVPLATVFLWNKPSRIPIGFALAIYTFVVSTGTTYLVMHLMGYLG